MEIMNEEAFYVDGIRFTYDNLGNIKGYILVCYDIVQAVLNVKLDCKIKENVINEICLLAKKGCKFKVLI